MGRIYAGVLGSVAFATVLARSLIHVGGVESSLWQAVICLLLFSLIGGALGRLAEWIVDDSVRARLAGELAAAAERAKQTTANSNTKKAAVGGKQ
jgi:hypothetical protein